MDEDDDLDLDLLESIALSTQSTPTAEMPRKKKALRVLDSEEKAKEWADFSLSEDDRKRVKFEYRPGESIRCGRYCSVIAFCSQGQNILQGG